jgi:hypothetical protein
MSTNAAREFLEKIVTDFEYRDSVENAMSKQHDHADVIIAMANKTGYVL